MSNNDALLVFALLGEGGGLPVLDLCVLIAYIGGVVVLGCALVRKNRSTDEFMAASRSLPDWEVGLSIFGNITFDLARSLGFPTIALQWVSYHRVRYARHFWRRGRTGMGIACRAGSRSASRSYA